MTDPKSRYARSQEQVSADGRVRYLERRFVARLEEPARPRPADASSSGRVDLWAMQRVGDPLAFWRACDLAVVLDPLTLVEPRPASDPSARTTLVARGRR